MNASSGFEDPHFGVELTVLPHILWFLSGKSPTVTVTVTVTVHGPRRTVHGSRSRSSS